ncbi:hypothetical protein FA15DRAFT_759387 [Coprinopsis marcescibilis]|uniref:Nephrocystin 3-like N-terminal domain-containing protein n=1 Tax=Coprinopsis marcescibilis TaxID=230819 RepID=A0A5C3KKG3_COPMA|nr:hypothetical protein FA15DRAFT_759387 [Coprinopsis marcescibilis]
MQPSMLLIDDIQMRTHAAHGAENEYTSTGVWSAEPASRVGVLEAAQHVSLRDNSRVIAEGGDNVVTNHYHGKSDALAILRAHARIEATHESETAAYAPRCKPGTRKSVLEDIMSWTTTRAADASAPPQLRLLWLSGPVGGGKTCIQREVVECCKKQGSLAASYFFSARRADLDNAPPFVPTIVLQLCNTVPKFQGQVEEEIKADPFIFDKSMEIQFERLITRPLEQLGTKKKKNKSMKALKSILNRKSPFLSKGRAMPRIIVIDGLDECRNNKDQVRIIDMLISALARSSFPFHIVLASRPEYDIRTKFDGLEIHHIKLEDYGCADADIELYLVDCLFHIRKRHPSASTIPSNWPSIEDVRKIVDKASGQFIYASTLITFIDNPRRDLVKMFKLAVDFHLSPYSTINPFSELDFLYALSLESTSSDVDTTMLKTLLHGIVVGGGKLETTQDLDEFFRLEPGTSATIFCDLHSIIRIPNTGSKITRHEDSGTTADPIRFYHKSLEDYLLSPTRAGKFHQTLLATHQQMFSLCVHHLLPWSLFNFDNMFFYRPAVTYATSSWIIHASYLLENGDPKKLLCSEEANSISYHIAFRPYVGESDPTFGKVVRFQSSIHETLCAEPGGCISLCEMFLRASEISKTLSLSKMREDLNKWDVAKYVEESMSASHEDWRISCSGDGISHLSQPLKSHCESLMNRVVDDSNIDIGPTATETTAGDW